MIDQAPSTVGPIFGGLPLEIRLRIYRQFFLICRREPKLAADGYYGYPTPDLRDSHGQVCDWILVHPKSKDPCHDYLTHNTEKVTSLLCVNHATRSEAQSVLYRTFAFHFCIWHDLFDVYDFTWQMSPLGKEQVTHLSFVMHISLHAMCVGSSILGEDERRLWVLKEGNDMLAHSLPNLRTVSFELRVMASDREINQGPQYDEMGAYLPDFLGRALTPDQITILRGYALLPDPIPSPITYNFLVEKCLAVARPFRRIHDLQFHWVGEHLGAHIADLCTERTSSISDWPWTVEDEDSYQTSLTELKRTLRCTMTPMMRYITNMRIQLIKEGPSGVAHPERWAQRAQADGGIPSIPEPLRLGWKD